MDGARWERIQEIFHGVSDLSPTKRQEILKNACEGDEVLLAVLSAMLEEDARGAHSSKATCRMRCRTCLTSKARSPSDATSVPTGS
jgi:hypothetical protein